jgi:hypothetical protein
VKTRRGGLVVGLPRFAEDIRRGDLAPVLAGVRQLPDAGDFAVRPDPLELAQARNRRHDWVRAVGQHDVIRSVAAAVDVHYARARDRRASAAGGASVINCCYAAREAFPSSTMTQTVDCPNLTFSDNQRSIAGGRSPFNVNRRVVNPAWIAGVLTSGPNFNAL